MAGFSIDSFTSKLKAGGALASLFEAELTTSKGTEDSSAVQDFAVVCDDSNNTPEVVDRNEFRGDIYIKPSRSINFIQLQFVAVRSGVEFAEIIG